MKGIILPSVVRKKTCTKQRQAGLRRDVREYVRQCIPCQRYKPENRKPQGLVQTLTYAHRFEILAIDLFGPLPSTKSKNSWIFVIEDTASKWVELFPLVEANAYECAKLLIEEYEKLYLTVRKLALKECEQKLVVDPQIQIFLTTKPTIIFSACGFFDINCKLATSMAAASTTYLVIMTQYSVSEP